MGMQSLFLSSMHHQCIIHVLSLLYPCIIRTSSMHHLYIICTSSVNHSYIIHTSSIHPYECIINSLFVHHQWGKHALAIPWFIHANLMEWWWWWFSPLKKYHELLNHINYLWWSRNEWWVNCDWIIIIIQEW